jgi:hypothetical protein
VLKMDDRELDQRLTKIEYMLEKIIEALYQESEEESEEQENDIEIADSQGLLDEKLREKKEDLPKF